MLCVFIAARFAFDVAPRTSTYASISALTPYDELDPESILASGGRIPIACSDQSTLELISGVSHTLSEELLQARNSIQRLTRRIGERAALLTIHGVGEKRVEQLLTYFDPGATCSKTLPYAPFKPQPKRGPPVR